MLLGEYVHSLDEKKRISLPVKFRKELGGEIVITRGLDTCLFLYSKKEWRLISEKIGNLGISHPETRGFGRFMFSGAVEMSVDSVGRILIPDFLRSFAKLSSRVVFAGVWSRVEAWDEELWNAYRARIEKEGDKLAENLGKIGIL